MRAKNISDHVNLGYDYGAERVISSQSSLTDCNWRSETERVYLSEFVVVQ